MRLIAREFLTCLVILFIIGGFKANKPKPLPEPASCESDKDCLKGKAKCVQQECRCIAKYGYGDGKTKCAHYAFHFPNKGVEDVVKISQMRSLTAFTVCLWMNSSNPMGTLVSYAVSNSENELLIDYNDHFEVQIGGSTRVTTVTANDGAWHHICLSWEKASGSWKFFTDGVVKQKGTNFMKGHTIGEGGTLTLGQDQDHVGGGFQADWSFQGMLSHVNIWDRVLGTSKIKEMSQSCLPDERNEGNVYKWVDFLSQGGVKLVEPSPCVPFTSLDYAFHFPNKGVEDVVKISQMRSLTAFTVCLWMNSSNPMGTLVSYAVSNSENELLIDYNDHFEFQIDGTTRSTTVTANDVIWHHICLSWEKASGSWKFFKDGLVKQEDTSFKKGHTIRKGGTLVLGQDQDHEGGGFEAHWSFQGMLSYVNVWDRVLGTSQIEDMSLSCLPDKGNEGNVYKWTDFLRQGGVKLVGPSPCVPFPSVDIDECLDDVCSKDATCTNSVRSYYCRCKTGYQGNGFYCSEVDECQSEAACAINATCTNTKGSFSCACDLGYSGDPYKACQDVDECKSTNCGYARNCTNTPGSYFCYCREGFLPDDQPGFCKDVDECKTMSSPCGTYNFLSCVNELGTYSCRCKMGYAFNKRERKCQDINECEKRDTCAKNAECFNDEGSFRCICARGYSGYGLYFCDVISSSGRKDVKVWNPVFATLLLPILSLC